MGASVRRVSPLLRPCVHPCTHVRAHACMCVRAHGRLLGSHGVLCEHGVCPLPRSVLQPDCKEEHLFEQRFDQHEKLW